MRDIRFAAKIIGKFKSIQSAIFAVVTVLLLSAVLVITGVSMRYTRNSIFENSAVYTQNIVQEDFHSRFVDLKELVGIDIEVDDKEELI